MFEMVIQDDGLDEVLYKSVLDKYEQEVCEIDGGLDGILYQSLDMFEEEMKGFEDPVDIRDMFESGGPFLVFGRISSTAKCDVTQFISLFFQNGKFSIVEGC